MNDETKTVSTDARSTIDPAISPQALAAIGGGKIAYVRPIRSDELNRLFPQAPTLQPGLDLFALLGADGTPIVVTDDRNTAIANAWENDLVPVSVH
ncbi:BQ00720 family protein [Alsobacter sp. R-9]